MFRGWKFNVGKFQDEVTEKFTRVPNNILDRAMGFGFTRCEGKSYPPQKTELNTELKTELKTLRAALAARAPSSFSSLSKPKGEKQGGSLGAPRTPHR